MDWVTLVAATVGVVTGYCGRSCLMRDEELTPKPLVMKRRCPGCGADVVSWRTFADGTVLCHACDGPRAA